MEKIVLGLRQLQKEGGHWITFFPRNGFLNMPHPHDKIWFSVIVLIFTTYEHNPWIPLNLNIVPSADILFPNPQHFPYTGEDMTQILSILSKLYYLSLNYIVVSY